MMLQGKTVVVGVTGGIAAYKSAQLVSDLVKLHCDVHVVMTENAVNFINPITFETLTKNKCLVDTFDRNFRFNIAHVSLSQKADVFIIAPASANMIAKAAAGIADDMLSTMLLAAKCQIIVAPAMNRYMYLNPIVQENIRKLKQYHFTVLEPAVGRLACDDVGIGKLPDTDVLIESVANEIAHKKDMKDMNILVTAGATSEDIDPVRFITNRSTGKMGCEIARAAVHRGANVTLISGSMTVKPPVFAQNYKVRSAEEMFQAVSEHLSSSDVLIMSAAVADYTPASVSANKMKKSDGDMSIQLKRTKDILAYAGEHKKAHQIICGFSMETENLEENSIKKLKKKNCDLIAANSLNESGAGFGTDTNRITLITKSGITRLELMSKYDAANAVLDAVLAISDTQKSNNEKT